MIVHLIVANCSSRDSLKDCKRRFCNEISTQGKLAFGRRYEFRKG